MEGDRLDFIIFGATGFTGKYTVKEAARLAKEKQFKFGVAGRRKEALESVVKEFAPNIENVPIIIATLDDENSLKEMAQRAKIIVNCCGPFLVYGEPVVKACIAARTHHVDVSGEPQYMEEIQLKYHQDAQDAGVYIVSACGFDSIPCDLGVIFTQQNFNGEINTIEAYLSGSSRSGGAFINYGTWHTAIITLSRQSELRNIRTKLFPTKLPTFWPKLKSRGKFHKCPVSEGWSVPFLGSDRSVVYRTQRYLFEKCKQRPVQFQCFITMRSLYMLLVMAFYGSIFLLMTKFKHGRDLLLKHPRFFSGGFISRDGPDPETMDNAHISVIFKAQGWPTKLSEPTGKHKDMPSKELITKVSGVNPGYGLTCTAMILSALTILKESAKMPDGGGVYSPGAAFGKTSLIKELNENELRFEVISSVEQ